MHQWVLTTGPRANAGTQVYTLKAQASFGQGQRLQTFGKGALDVARWAKRGGYVDMCEAAAFAALSGT